MTTQADPRRIAVGDPITHPDFTGARAVLDVRPCCVGADGVLPHTAYIVADEPGWGTTWVCARQAGRVA